MTLKAFSISLSPWKVITRPKVFSENSTEGMHLCFTLNLCERKWLLVMVVNIVHEFIFSVFGLIFTKHFETFSTFRRC